MIDPRTLPAGAEGALTEDEQHETREWIDALEYVLAEQGPERVAELLKTIITQAEALGVNVQVPRNSPYINTIPAEFDVPYPGDRDIERRIKSVVRWNAMAMVVKANRDKAEPGGHISTYASAATLYEVGYNHFFKGRTDKQLGDLIYFQGHASPGMYSRAYVEGRIPAKLLHNFRRELRSGGGLCSYPHPWLMPDFWQFPTVSMGLGPINSIYQARFNRYVHDRGLVDTSNSRVWAFLGDGETDEPESLGAITLAAREQLDNLTWVVNCNLQRLDGPVRGNSKIIQELEAAFHGAGWNVIKVIWGSAWDNLLSQDKEHGGWLVRRMNEVVDGEYQKYSAAGLEYVRKHFFGKYPELAAMVADIPDNRMPTLKRGGLDPQKVYTAYKFATEHKGQPTVILAKTIKGYGLGESGEGKNITHQKKKYNDEELRAFRDRFNIPVPDGEIKDLPFYKFPASSPEHKYIQERRKALGGHVPKRVATAPPLKMPGRDYFKAFYEGSGDKAASTTMAFERIFSSLMANKEFGKQIVPIIPDEARTFGLETLFRQYGIYSHVGQLYEPVDKDQVAYYLEKKNGQLLEEGITEAGSMASFIAAGTAYASLGITMMPFFIYYSMFGFQRVGDQMWLAGDIRARGFLLGATAGRTTLNGEGLQHQDGHSHLLASTIPNFKAYHPAFGYELALIIQDGMKRMFEKQDDLVYYITLGNENYVQPVMPAGVEDGVIEGLYKFKAADKKLRPRANILGDSSAMLAALKAQEILAEKYDVGADVWSATSYKQLRYGALEAERWNMLHPGAKARKKSYLEKTLEKVEGVFVAVSESMRSVPDQIGKWVPGGLMTLGTDGFGRSSSREELREFFETDAAHVVVAVLSRLADTGEVKAATVKKAIEDLGVDPEKDFSLFV
ncbi:MAG: pyruvate dehydrogenase (acetyl-transferring), homodimeric type [Candidatus Sumerlaeaceae bacterium]|nr:pyruvate dehydrogenase (acetyl-transferring), homodimeric type [Candidatus Sumerlaeaceae bacterium]